MNRKGVSEMSFILGSIGFLLIFNLLLVSIPSPMQEFVGFNTTQLQENTDLSASVNANQTTSTNVVDQAGDLIAVYSNPSSTNRFISTILLIYLFGIISYLLIVLWIG